MISIFLYLLLLTGLVLLVVDSFRMIVVKINIANKIRESKHIQNTKPSRTDEVTERLFQLLQITVGAKTRGSVTIFAIISGLCGMLILVIVGVMASFRLALLAAVLACFLPYVFLQIRLQNFRVAVSREGEILVTEILNNYKLNHYNMREAIEQTAITIMEAPHSKKMLYDLSRKFNVAATKEDIKKALDTFRYSIGTSWANILSTNIYFAQVDGIVVVSSLTDLTASIVKARKATEQNHRENNEANLILKVLVPAGALLTVVGAVGVFGFTFKKYIQYQFFTEMGATWFLGITGAYIAAITVSTFLTKNKMDL